MKFDDFLSSVLPYVTGCPDSLALDHIKKAARGFCARTLVWNYSCRPISATAGLANYTLLIGEHEEVVRVLRCEVNGTEYAVPNAAIGRAATRSMTGNLCTLSGGINDFTLSPAPWDDGLEIIMDVAVKPSMRAEDWPDDLAEHVEAIASGAIATLCAIPKKEWSDDLTSKNEMAKFNDRIGTMAIKVSRGLGKSRHGAAVVWF